MKRYADMLITQMLADKFNYSEISTIVFLMQERLQNVRKVKIKKE